MNDKIRINLQMAGVNYPLTIERKDEEIVRAAAKQVNMRINAYRGYYPKVTQDKIATMVAYQFALECLQEKQRNDTAPYTAKIEELTGMLDDYFQKT